MTKTKKARAKKAKGTITFTDRYSAAGTLRPGPNACKRCEGMGFTPTRCSCGGKKKGHSESIPNWCWEDPCSACGGTRIEKGRME